MIFNRYSLDILLALFDHSVCPFIRNLYNLSQRSRSQLGLLHYDMNNNNANDASMYILCCPAISIRNTYYVSKYIKNKGKELKLKILAHTLAYK